MNEVENYVRVENNTSLVRDTTTGAIINNNSSELEEYKKRRSMSLKMRDEIKRHADDILVLRNELSEIKSMIIQLLRKD